MKDISEIKKALENRNDRSAWDKGITLYAFELLDEYEEQVKYKKRNAESRKEFKEWLLNGADNWNAYSWGGSSLIYSGDIAERLCTPSELKRCHDGERRPNRSEEWLDTQARALSQAAHRLSSIAF